MADKAETYIQVRLSKKLKDSFTEICKEQEISISDEIRVLVNDFVRNYRRKNVKAKEDD